MKKPMTKNTLEAQPEVGFVWPAAWILQKYPEFVGFRDEISSSQKADQVLPTRQITTPAAVSSNQSLYNPHRSFLPDRAWNPRFPPLDV